MHKIIFAILITMFATTSVLAKAGGGKMRLASDLIEEGYVLCDRQGVETVTVEADGTVIVIDCDDVPGPAFPGSED